LKERHSFSVLSLNPSERQKLKRMTSPESSVTTEKDELTKSNEKSFSKHLQKYKSKDKLKDKAKDKPIKKSTLSKNLKEEKSFENSKKYYETLTEIIKRNKDNSKDDYSSYLNDIDLKITSNFTVK